MLTKRIAAVTLILFIFTPWLLRAGGNIDKGSLLQFLSFKLFFFDASIFGNIGKETGVVYPSFLPFVLYGLYRLIKSGKIMSIVVVLFLLIIASFTRGLLVKVIFFPIAFLLSYFAAVAIVSLRKKQSWPYQTFLFLGIIAILYEISQYFHYLQLHYLRDLPTLGIP